MQVSPPTTIMGSEFTPKLQSYNINQISTQGALLQRPACEVLFRSLSEGANTTVTTVIDYSGVTARGLIHFQNPINPNATNEWLFAVWGTTIYKLGLDGNGNPEYINLGTIDGTERISYAVGYNGIALCGGESCYFISKDTLTLTDLSAADADLPDSIDVSRVDGRFVWTPTTGGVLVYSEVNDAGNIDALSFFDAETLPDGNKATVNINNDLFVLGSESIERFRNVGTSAAPFLRVNNSIISVGYVGGLIETKDSFGFLGKDKDGGFAFFVYSSGGVQKISSDKVTEDLNLNYSLTDLETCHGQRFNWGGVDCYVFTLSDKDYLFNVETGWSYISSGTDFSSGLWGYSSAKKINYSFAISDGWYLQGEDGIYALTTGNNDITRGGDTNTDANNFSDDSFIRGFQLSIREPSETVFTPSKVDVGIEHTTTDSTVNLSVSHDGSTWSTNFPQTTGTSTENKLVFAPMGGLGLYDGYVGIRVSSISNIAFSVENMNIT